MGRPHWCHRQGRDPAGRRYCRPDGPDGQEGNADRAAGPLAAIPEALGEFALERSEDGAALTYTYDTRGERTGITRLLADLQSEGIALRDVQTKQSSLEEIFVDLVREETH